ncbi:MAG: type II toxin-antitoxin system VapC family toxin [FCB group bacterium]|jgi:predicted nucleic acid-binding protein
MKYLIDTNVLSELLKNEPDINVVKWINKCQQSDLFISVLTLGEIKKGIQKLVTSRKKVQLSKWLENDLIKKFGKNIIKIDLPISLRWGIINAQAEEAGKNIPVIDSLIAATAIEYNLTLVTRNVKDFSQTNCKLFNPWE